MTKMESPSLATKFPMMRSAPEAECVDEGREQRVLSKRASLIL